MPKQFTFGSLIRLIPFELLDGIAKELKTPLKFPAKPTPSEVKECIEAIEKLSKRDHDRLEDVFRSIHLLASDGGIAAIYEVAASLPSSNLANHASGNDGPAAFAAWTWLHQWEVFQSATKFEQIDHLRTWRRRTDLPQQEPKVDTVTCKSLAQCVSKLLLNTQNRGRRCTIDVLRRGNLYLYFAHPDDFVQASLAHDTAGRLGRRLHRPTFDVVFAFDPIKGALETSGRVPPKLKDKLDSAFAEACLEYALGPLAKGPSYHLDLLLKPDFEFVPDPSMGVTARIVKLSLGVLGTKRTLDLGCDPQTDSSVKTMFNYLNPRLASREQLSVRSARIEFQFDGNNGRDPGKATITVTGKTCNLRNLSEWRATIIAQVLEDSGLMGVTMPAEECADV